MFIKPKPNTIYIKIKTNELYVKHIESGNELSVTADEPFTTSRLLIGHFKVAEKLLTKAIKSTYKSPGLFSGSPDIIIQPLEYIEGGLCEVEKRTIQELAFGSFKGVCKVIVWAGNELSDHDAQLKAKST